MKQQLPKAEIEKLFEFVKSKNVPCKDVQYEIVDHLASAMEDLKEENPEWSYELCLDQVYKKFPITGFALLQMQIEESLQKYWKRRLWPYLLQFFKLPKIIITLAIFFSLQQLFNSIGSIEMSSWIFGLNPNSFVFLFMLLLFALVSYIHNIKFRNNASSFFPNLDHQDKLQFVISFNEAARIVTLSSIAIPAYITNFLLSSNPMLISFQGVYSYLFAWLFVAIGIHFYLTFKVFPPILRKEATERYSHLHMQLAN